MIVITGATGKVGGGIADILLSRKEKIRVVGRSAAKLAGLVKRGAESAVGDLLDTAFLAETFRGADAVYVLIPPNPVVADFRAYQDKVGESIVSAISTSGIKYVVNLSSQGAELTTGTGPVVGLHYQEERLNKLAGTHVLHLRPTYFMENLLMNIDIIKRWGFMGSAIRGDVRFAVIASKDIAAYAAERLVKRDFSGKTIVDLLGQRDVSLNEIAAIIGPKIGKPSLAYVTFSPEDAEKGMVAAGLSADMSKQYVELSTAINEGRFAVNRPRTTGNTTPTPIEHFADVFAELYRKAGEAKAA